MFASQSPRPKQILIFTHDRPAATEHATKVSAIISSARFFLLNAVKLLQIDRKPNTNN